MSAPAEAPSHGRLDQVEAGLLLGLLLLLGVLIVPAHWASIWMDPEFTGWVVPIGNRFADGLRLYDDGGHIPMPPLPFVLTALLSGGHGTWLLESGLNYGFQAGTLLVLYFGLRHRLPARSGFWATLATVPVFLTLTKTILYDAMAQFLVAAAAVALLRAAERPSRRGPGAPARLVSLATAGVLLACCVLTKQSTGIGLILGATLLLLLDPGGGRLRRRVISVALLGGFTLAASVALTATLWAGSFISIPGLVQDVFLTGSQPKGGPAVLQRALHNYALLTAQEARPWAGLALVLVGLGGLSKVHPRSRGGLAAALLATGAVLACASYALGAFWDVGAVHTASAKVMKLLWQPPIRSPVMWTGFFTTLGLAGAWLWPLRGPVSPTVTTVGRLCLILLPATIFHTLSVDHFRWTYDNNPFVTLTLAALLLGSAGLLARLPMLTLPRAVGLLGPVLLVATWSKLAPHLHMVAQCTRSWPEVDHLHGARLRPAAAGMRSLVHLVRNLAPDAQADQVLLLPEDPNVQAWFQRPRPDLSSAILFVDQYWDHDVDADLAALLRAPPKVIIIGPRRYVRPFNSQWTGSTIRGVDRLITAVREQLLPASYAHAQEHEIRFQGHSEVMDIYVRKDGG